MQQKLRCQAKAIATCFQHTPKRTLCTHQPPLRIKLNRNP
jgi:hypothetical protein